MREQKGSYEPSPDAWGVMQAVMRRALNPLPVTDKRVADEAMAALMLLNSLGWTLRPDSR